MATQIDSLEEANEATLENGQALRIQPPAPGATRYYWVEDGEWRFKKCGHNYSNSVDVETVGERLERNIPKNDMPGGGVLAVSMVEVHRH
ncbi:hypothetical protein [Halorhabdus rudnickae]|uniref:hypothetical protein n=1 Tax=Halorhabdus rudnickae TaxID=1775544 RepID=UPI0010823593|nr:hypothetical protein [Halorhabdus rudnickae]